MLSCNDYAEAEANAKLSELLGEGFKRSIYWNKYKVIPDKTYNANDSIRELIDYSCQGVKRLFVLTYDHVNGITAEKITTLKMMEEVFMINQLMTYFENK